VNSSETFQKLLKLNMNLSILDNYSDLATYLVKADFEKDVQPYINFLLDNGVEESKLGRVLNRNPFLLTLSLDDLEVRKNYFLFRKFSKSDIANILMKAPTVFSYDTKTIDARLGFLVQEYTLQPSELRHVIVAYPRLIELQAIQIKKSTFMFKEEMGFSAEETKNILL